MLKSYEAIYDRGQLHWLGTKPTLAKAKVIVVVEVEVEEEYSEIHGKQSIKRLKGIAPKPERTITLEEMDEAIQSEGAKL